MYISIKRCEDGTIDIKIKESFVKDPVEMNLSNQEFKELKAAIIAFQVENYIKPMVAGIVLKVF